MTASGPGSSVNGISVDTNNIECAVCGNSGYRPYFTAGAYFLVQCSVCGLVYTRNFKFSATSYDEDNYFTRKNQYTARWDEFCRLFEPLVHNIHRYKKTGKFLDVGAGVGTLLSVAAKQGFVVQGVEVSSWAANFARTEKGLPVQTGTLEAAAFGAREFDVVVINHVLEHVQDPVALLREAGRILKDDGLLVIGVPNIGSIMAGLVRSRWASLRPEEHIWHFTPATLRSLIGRSGFREVYFEAMDNYPAVGWSLKAIFRRLVNGLSMIMNRSEAMLIYAHKDQVSDNG